MPQPSDGPVTWTDQDDLRGPRLSSPADLTRLLPWLEYRDGRLAITGGPSLDDYLDADRPVLLYSVQRALNNFAALCSAFGAHFDRLRVAYALKACYSMPIVRALVGAGAGIEVMSELELELARQAGCAGTSIVSNGVGLRAGHVRRAVDAGALVIVDNLADLTTVDAVARELGTRVRLGLRVSPDVSGPRFISSSGKLGCDWASGDFAALVDAALGSSSCDVVALHAHQLTHCHDATTYERVVAGVAEVACALLETRGLRFHTVDIGGGLDTHYLLTARGLGPETFAAAAAKALSAIPYDFELVVEPGRFIVADAAVGLTNVTGEKTNGDRRWRITDLGSNVLIPLPELAYPPVPLRWPQSAEWASFDVGDGTCAPTVLCRDARLPVDDTGRRLAVLNVGAYTSVFAESWAFPLPDILVWDGSSVELSFGPAQRIALFAALHGVNPF